MTTVPRPAIERLWPGATVVCIGTGPSLTQAQVDACRGARTIAINDAYTVAPWADVLYASDPKWWAWHQGAPGFGGLKVSLAPVVVSGVVSLRIAGTGGRAGLSTDPTALATGYSSGYAAINLAYHLAGPCRVILIGYDFHGDHFFGSHPDKTRPAFLMCLAAFEKLAAPAAAAGLAIVNCTPNSALTCFPTATLASVLEVAA